MNLQWSAAALSDLDRIFYFLMDKNAQAALDVLDLIEEAVENLRKMPELGVSLHDFSLRREWFVPFGKNGYSVRYLPDHDADQLVILRIYHSRELRE